MNGVKLFNRIPFTKEIKTLINGVSSISTLTKIENVLSATDFPLEEMPYIMMRDNTLSLPNNVDSFVIYTSANPYEKMKYTATDDTVRMNDQIDGGRF